MKNFVNYIILYFYYYNALLTIKQSFTHTGGKHCTWRYMSFDDGDSSHHILLNQGMFLAIVKFISVQAEYHRSHAENYNWVFFWIFSSCFWLFTFAKFIIMWFFSLLFRDERETLKLFFSRIIERFKLFGELLLASK